MSLHCPTADQVDEVGDWPVPPKEEDIGSNHANEWSLDKAAASGRAAGAIE
jgi:hypothetical protein